MSEQERVAVADAADMIVNNYAFTKDGTNVRILNLRTGSAALIFRMGVFLRRAWKTLSSMLS